MSGLSSRNLCCRKKLVHWAEGYLLWVPVAGTFASESLSKTKRIGQLFASEIWQHRIEDMKSIRR